MNILTQATALLKLHDGHCSIKEDSRFGIAFKLLEQSGDVLVKPSGTVGFIDIYSVDFKAKFSVDVGEKLV